MATNLRVIALLAVLAIVVHQSKCFMGGIRMLDMRLE